MLRTLIAFSLLTFVLPEPAQAQTGSVRPGAVTLPNTELRRLHSKAVGTVFEIRVRLPERYESSDKRYPVLYLLDGDGLFGLATDVIRYLEWGGLVPDLIVVAPAYASVHSPENGGTNMRNRDFSVFPAQAGFVPGGGARFLEFLRGELIPYIEKEFRADGADRILAGFSRGADFTVYSLFIDPALFNRYIVLDNFYPEYRQLENAFAERSRDLPKKVYVASRFPRGGLHDFTEQMKSRGYKGLAVEFGHVNARHFAFAGEGLTRGLVSVFNKPSILSLLLPRIPHSTAGELIAEYRQLRQTSPDIYDFREAELSDLGSALAHMGRLKDAIEIYRVNLETYPKSPALLRRLAAAYERAEDVKQAIATYRILLQLDPDDRAAAAAIARLERSK